ncbi:MAG: hypothetical protein VB674_00370, partial [Vicinamibacterales bacterium]
VGYKDGAVHLRKKDGTTAIVPRANLSRQDQLYLRKELVRRKAREKDRLPARPMPLDNNLKCVDLSDLKGPLPLDVVSSAQILKQTEDWEHSSYKNPDWPVGGHKSLGYPTMVKNDHGKNQDGKYYLYYAHHDPMSGIGCAVAASIKGPYVKVANLPDSDRKHSMVLTVEHYKPDGPNRDDPSHYCSPCVVWNEEEQLWFMYFHYFNHLHGAWTASADDPGEGWQMTALATCPDLSSHEWTIWKNAKHGKVSVWDIVPVLPTTGEDWMKSQSSYHAIQRLPDGQWLAFLRGTPTTGPRPTVGFATSDDGRVWKYFPENPVIAQGKPWTQKSKEYRPAFIGYLGSNKAGQQVYLVAWAEHPEPHVIYSLTTDFKTFRRDPRGYAKWGGADGLVSVWREGDRLYLFAEKNVYEMALPVSR